MDQVQSSYNTWLAYPQPRKIKILRIVASVCFVLFLFIFVIYAFGGTTTKKKDKHGVVIFMEVLPSSVQALRYLLQRRDVQVLMIVLTVNSWSSNLVAANTNLRYFEHLLHAEGLQRELQVTYGQSVAAIDADFVASINYQTDSSSAAIPITCTYQRVLKETLLAAADTMFGAVKEQLNDTLPDYFDAPLASLMAKRSASFLVLGPATDAAYFVKEHPDLRKRITELTVAGGTFFAVADAQRVYSPNNNAEINFFFDPLAAKYLVQGSHGIPVTLLPLDASCAWSERMNSIYSSPSTNSSASFIGRSVEGYFQALKVVGSQRRLGVEMLAAVYLVDGQLRGQAEVTKFPGDVVSGVSMILDGKSYHSGTNPFRADVKAVLRMRCDAVDANVEEVSHFAF